MCEHYQQCFLCGRWVENVFWTRVNDADRECCDDCCRENNSDESLRLAEFYDVQVGDIPASGIWIDAHYPFEDDPFEPYPPEDSPLRLV